MYVSKERPGPRLLRMPENVRSKGADEPRQQGGQEGMVMSPSLYELTRGQLVGQDAPQVEQGDHEDEQWPARGD